jgi:pimeloyl-[acyl-carrier protein] methyl ester esterase
VGTTEKTEIVLLPGLDGTGLLFADFVRECPPEIVPRVIEYPRDRFLNYRELLHLVEGRLPRQSEFIILGESFSGPVAVMLAAQRPRGLRAVVLAATFVARPGPRWTGLLPWRVLLRLRAPGLILRWLVAGRDASPALLRQLREAVGTVSSDVLAARIREHLIVNVVRELRRIAVPILYLQGVSDRLIRPQAWRTIRRAKPEVILARIAAPHMVLQTAPRESWEHIVRLVR